MYKYQKKIIFPLLVLLCIGIITIVGRIVYEQYVCNNQGGFYLSNETCYFPINEWERQKIIDDGGVKKEYDIGEAIEFEISKFNLTI